jgi:hypothetical protein
MQPFKKMNGETSKGHNRCSGKHIVRFCNGVLPQGVASKCNKFEFRDKYVAVQQLQIYKILKN